MLLACAATSIASAAPPSDTTFRAPYLPTADDAVIQQVPPASDRNVAAIRTLRESFDRAPKDLTIASRLAAAYIDFGRQLGDAHYVGYAEAVIARWVTSPSPPASTLVLQATILQYRHQFAEARALLKRALATDPRNVQAWLTLATLDMVQGDYATAADGCRQVARNGGPIVGAACSANVGVYVGRARQSLDVLQAIGVQGGASTPSYAAWIEGLGAEGAERLGDWPLAETHYRNALRLEPEDNFLLVAYADFLLDRDRPQEVLALLKDHAQSDTAYLRIVLAQVVLRSPDLPRSRFVMAARFAALAQRGEDLFGREQVRFALHAQGDARGALALAEENWKVQRAPWDARVFLEAAVAAKRPDAAIPVIEFVERTKLEDPVVAALVAQLRSLPATGAR